MKREDGRIAAGVQGTGEEMQARTSRLGFHSTGSPALDGLLGGGLREGRLVEFFGRSNSGKTQLAMQAVLLAAWAGSRSLYLDTEGAFRPERLEEMGEARNWHVSGLLDSIIYVRCDSSAAQMDTVRKMGSRDYTSGCRLVVIDTLTRNFTIDMPGAENLQSRQAALGVHMSEMARDAYINSRAYLLANRVTFGPVHDVQIGGRTTQQLVGASLRLEREKSGITGTLSKGESVLMTIGRSGIT